MYARHTDARHTQQGIILFVVLVLLLVLSLLGVTLARTQTVEERLAQNDDNHQAAFQAAEAALRAGVDALLAGSYTNGGTTISLLDSAFNTAVPTPGLYILNNESSAPQSIATVVNWSSAAAVLAYNGPALPGLPTASQVPTFLIEKLPGATAPAGMCSSSTSTPVNPHVYRITAHGFGGDGTASATLQQIVYKCA
jgi:type IV pilus assembly protein PilX